MLEPKERFGLRLMRHGGDEKVEVVEGKILSIICMFFKKDSQSLKREDCFQDVEVLTEKQIFLHFQFVRADLVKARKLLSLLHV